MLEPIEIARAEERRQAIGTSEIARESEHVGGGIMSFGGVGSWQNQACGLGLDGPVLDSDLDRLVEFYVSRRVEPKIEVCPFVDPSLVEGLASRGFTLREFENVLVFDLTEGREATLPNGWPEGLELRVVDPNDEEQVALFVEWSTIGFREPGGALSDVLRESVLNMVTHDRCTSYLALLDGEPVGGGAMESAPPVACLFGASVGEPFRRRGVQQAMIARRVERAREQGCDFVCIHSRPGIPTERNATRLGFGVAYSKVVMAMAGDGLAVSP